MLLQSILKCCFNNIKNPLLDVYYEILLSANKDYHMARRIISLKKYN